MKPTRRALLASLASSPVWLSSALAAEPSERQVELFSRWHEGRRLALPLLVVVIPDDGTRWDRGNTVGAALNEATPRLLGALAGYLPVCATREELHLLGVEVHAGHWVVEVHTDAVPARTRALNGPRLGGDEAIDLFAQQLLAFLGPGPVARAEAGRERWVKSRIPGSYWANTGGCGLHVEEAETSRGYACGMGSVPERGARFLLFVSAD